ncbi:KRAB [Mytilus coruscus]|uniref:KRAB n=1 Tax=Mytilus coruscus TaxID=42192 RepID=A0A6J8DRW8_MYTCO|nr:KRAB [Mytilus coruscus]
MANTICQSHDYDVYCLELDEFDGLKIVVKGHNYGNFKRDHFTDHNGNISDTVHRLPSQDTCMTQSSPNFKCKYSPSSILRGRKISENSTAGGKNITAQQTTVESIITAEQTSNATNITTDPTSNATNVAADPTSNATNVTTEPTSNATNGTTDSTSYATNVTKDPTSNAINVTTDSTSTDTITTSDVKHETNIATLSSTACSGKKNITKSLTSEITQQTTATGCNFKLSAGFQMLIQSTSSNIECEKQMERRRNQLQRCSFTDNRPASHSQPEIHYKCSENKQCLYSVSSDTPMSKGTKSYKCSLCEKQFSDNSNLYAHLKIHDWCQNVKSSTNIDNILTLPEPSITTSTAQQTGSIVPYTTLPSVIANTIQRSSGIANEATPSAFVEGNTSEPSTTSSNGILKPISVINSTNLTTFDFINIPKLPTVRSIATPVNFFDHKTIQRLPLFDSKIMSATPENFVDHDTTRCLPPVDSKIRSATPENCFNHEATHCLPPVDPKIMSASLSNSSGFNKSRTSANNNTQTSISTRLNKKHPSTRSFVSNISSLPAPVSAVPHRPNIKKRSTRVGCNMKPSTCDRSNRTASSNSGRRKLHSKLHAYTDLNKCNKGKKLYSSKNYLERPYNCATCKSKFIRKYDLERHTRMHTGDKPYQCKECGKRFPENYRLQSHRKTHKSSYQSECPVCGKLYLQHSTLQTHMKIHYWRQTI